jgi:uncharacterized Zn finger protein
MGKKLHIICETCGSDDVKFVINEPCADASLNVASVSCSDCGELTGIAEWSDFNGRELIDKRKPASQKLHPFEKALFALGCIFSFGVH